MTGQSTIIPPAPKRKEDYIDAEGRVMREDYLLKNLFTPAERKQLELEDRMLVQLAS